jgi:hypothetical protein
MYGMHARPAIGAHINYPPPSLANERQQRLGHRHGAEHVDVKLPAQIGEGDDFQRSDDADARVVHQTGQAAIADFVADESGGLANRLGIRHVNSDRCEPRAGLSA